MSKFDICSKIMLDCDDIKKEIVSFSEEVNKFKSKVIHVEKKYSDNNEPNYLNIKHNKRKNIKKN